MNEMGWMAFRIFGMFGLWLMSVRMFLRIELAYLERKYIRNMRKQKEDWQIDRDRKNWAEARSQYYRRYGR